MACHAFRTPGVSPTGKTVLGPPCHCFVSVKESDHLRHGVVARGVGAVTAVVDLHVCPRSADRQNPWRRAAEGQREEGHTVNPPRCEGVCILLPVPEAARAPAAVAGHVAHGGVQPEGQAERVHVLDDRLHAVWEEAREGDEGSVRVAARVPAVVQHDPAVAEVEHALARGGVLRDKGVGHRADLAVGAVVLAAWPDAAPLAAAASVSARLRDIDMRPEGGCCLRSASPSVASSPCRCRRRGPTR